MPTINEMIAQPVEYGFIGGMRKQKEDVRTQEMHEVDVEGKKTDIYKKQAELEEFIEGRETRRKKRKVEELQAEREIANAPLLDEAMAVSIENAIQKASSELHSSQIEEIGRAIGAITNQKQYNQFMNTLDERDIQALGFEPSGNYKQDQDALKYIQTQAIINMEHHRALEMQALRNAGALAEAKNKSPKLTPGAMELFQPADEPTVRARLTQDSYFDPLWKSMNPFKSDATAAQASLDLAAASGHIMSRANEIVTQTDAIARRLNDPTKRVGLESAYRQAQQEYKVLAHKLENNQLVPMENDEFESMMLRYTTTMTSQIEKARPQEWKALPPEEKQRIIYDSILRLRQAQYYTTQQALSYGK